MNNQETQGTTNDADPASVDRVVTLPSMGADVSRCNGHIYFEGKQVCPQRDKCARYLVPAVEGHPRQCWVFVIGADQIGKCEEFWST